MVGGAAGGKAIDFKAIWETALAQRSKGTCNWFLESLEFQRLVEERGTFLWGTGMPGSGKTILISVCIERLQETFKNHQDVAIAYVYFRYSEQISWPDVLAAIIEQLAWSCNGAHDVLLAIYSERRNPRPTTRSERDLIAILQRIINDLNKVFIAIDGLDEVADETRVKLLEAFSSLDANILVTSRPLEPYASYAPKALWVPIQARTEDIGKLVEDRIQRNPRLKAILQGKPDLVKKLSDSIKEKSQGMFLLARLQMDALQSSNSINSLFRKLSSLPSGISAMYQQTLERINAQPEEDASIAHRVFLWLLHGFETLSVEGLQHALAVSLEDMSYDEGDVVSDSLLMSMCCGLVTTITIGSQPWEPQRREVRFIRKSSTQLRKPSRPKVTLHADYTTQEFLRSVAFPGFSNPHSLLSVACLGYLQAVNIESLFGEDTADLPYAAVATHPFLRYAYDNWGRHAKESERHGSLHQHTLSFLQRCNKFPLRVERPSKRYTFQSTVTRAWGLHLAAWWGLVGVISSGNLPCPPTATCDDFSPFHLAIGSAFSLSRFPGCAAHARSFPCPRLLIRDECRPHSF
ncbi:hypothetical protein FA13DRAFT_987346 [Coprinellus micaceus]|uniref:Nephrocystin 3-like N-terminal domain-containing protein n=1 Tax=Coprinellus micaceus TaxID=71717 RepID=A0A4Y7SZ37_COPMI|nr:hypothetical protein FA13DRAFT_987346 [Coprinellus micaceus]